jgi:hypothetical protein
MAGFGHGITMALAPPVFLKLIIGVLFDVFNFLDPNKKTNLLSRRPAGESVRSYDSQTRGSS